MGLPHRHDNGRELGAVGVTQLVEHLVEVGIFALELVDEERAGDVVFLGVLVGVVGADLRSGAGIDDNDHGVEDRGSGGELTDEVGVAGDIDEVEAESFVLDVGRAQLDGVLV